MTKPGKNIFQTIALHQCFYSYQSRSPKPLIYCDPGTFGAKRCRFLANGLGTGLCCYCHVDSFARQWLPTLYSLLAQRELWAVSHLWGMLIIFTCLVSDGLEYILPGFITLFDNNFENWDPFDVTEFVHCVLSFHKIAKTISRRLC